MKKTIVKLLSTFTGIILFANVCIGQQSRDVIIEGTFIENTTEFAIGEVQSVKLVHDITSGANPSSINQNLGVFHDIMSPGSIAPIQIEKHFWNAVDGTPQEARAGRHRSLNRDHWEDFRATGMLSNDGIITIVKIDVFTDGIYEEVGIKPIRLELK